MIYKRDQSIRVMPVHLPQQILLSANSERSYQGGYSYMDPSSMMYNPSSSFDFQPHQDHQQRQHHQSQHPSYTNLNHAHIHAFEPFPDGCVQHEMQSSHFQGQAAFDPLPSTNTLPANLPVNSAALYSLPNPHMSPTSTSFEGPQFRMSHAQHEFSKRRQQSMPFEAQSMRE